MGSIVPPSCHHVLLDLYYEHVHRVLPILEPRKEFEIALASDAVPASLLAAVFWAAVRFKDLDAQLRSSECEWKRALYDFIFQTITLGARTPTLRTIQAMLIYLQTPPSRVREPNHPGFWALTCQVSESRTNSIQAGLIELPGRSSCTGSGSTSRLRGVGDIYARA